MCQAIEELNRKAAEKATLETERRERKRVALGILTYEKIAEISQLTLEEIRELNAQRSA